MNYKKIYESNLKENLSEPELMGETLKKNFKLDWLNLGIERTIKRFLENR